MWGSGVMSGKHGRNAQLFKSAKMHSNPEPKTQMSVDKSSNLSEPVSYL